MQFVKVVDPNDKVKVLSGHCVHFIEPGELEYVPIGQRMQVFDPGFI